MINFSIFSLLFRLWINFFRKDLHNEGYKRKSWNNSPISQLYLQANGKGKYILFDTNLAFHDYKSFKYEMNNAFYNRKIHKIKFNWESHSSRFIMKPLLICWIQKNQISKYENIIRKESIFKIWVRELLPLEKKQKNFI